jgi:tRNA pseudouridine55 synthase
MHGILNLDKPAGLSSARAVDRVKRLLPRGTKVGHAGTLDPFATGVLLVLVGKATKSCEALMNLPKQYETTIKLGATTATDDPESPETPTPNAAEPLLQAIEAVLTRMTGTVMQRPPAFSAMKIAGRRAYELARKGAPADLAARPVRIDAIQIVHWQWPLLRLVIDCGRGTYIRSIARDLGEELRVGGYLTQLRRTRVGEFKAEDAVALDRLAESSVVAGLIPV